MAFFHIPTSEFRIAYEELDANGWKDTENTKYISGVWDELLDGTTGSRIWHGGITKEGPLADIDRFFETLGPDGMNVLEACYCGHDHVNNAWVNTTSRIRRSTIPVCREERPSSRSLPTAQGLQSIRMHISITVYRRINLKMFIQIISTSKAASLMEYSDRKKIKIKGV